jgi:hypothetical protein
MTLTMPYERLSDYLPTLLSIGIAVYVARWLYTYLDINRQVRGLPVLRSGIEIMQSAIRAQLPHIPFLCPVRDYTIEDPWKS